jgi:pilus assembly protein CpaF
MLQIEILHPDGNVQHLQVPDECVIGKGGQNEVRLDSWRVSKEHARLMWLGSSSMAMTSIY